MTHATASVRRTFIAAFVAALTLIILPATAGAWGRGHHEPHHHGRPPHCRCDHGPKPVQPGRGHIVGTMTRNLYLGADLTPAILAPDLESFVAANGQILREVTANDFPVRAKGLAHEILEKQPDLVGLQEVALWRTAPPSLTPVLTGEPTATTVRYDYLKLLLEQLNKGRGNGQQYHVVISQNEFDLEAPADENGVAGDGPNSLIPNAEVNGRLTMRDVILARNGAGVTTENPESANFSHNLVVSVANVPVTVKRGWTAVDAKVRGSHWFRFVNTHLESFEPIVRAEQAGELVAPGGPATSDLPVVLVGDLNSDDDTVAGIERLAYETLLGAGLVERSTGSPLGCCLDSSLLAEGAGGSVADFDQQVDHVMTSDPAGVALQSSAVTGLQPVNGFWDSDHAGLFSALRFGH